MQPDLVAAGGGSQRFGLAASTSSRRSSASPGWVALARRWTSTAAAMASPCCHAALLERTSRPLPGHRIANRNRSHRGCGDAPGAVTLCSQHPWSGTRHRQPPGGRFLNALVSTGTTSRRFSQAIEQPGGQRCRGASPGVEDMSAPEPRPHRAFRAGSIMCSPGQPRCGAPRMRVVDDRIASDHRPYRHARIRTRIGDRDRDKRALVPDP